MTTYIFQDYHHYTFDDLGFLNSIFLGSLSLFLVFFVCFLLGEAGNGKGFGAQKLAARARFGISLTLA